MPPIKTLWDKNSLRNCLPIVLITVNSYIRGKGLTLLIGYKLSVTLALFMASNVLKKN